MKKRIAILLVLLFTCFTLCSCGYPPTERQTFPLCLTLDKTKDGKVQLGIQAPQNGQSDGDGSAPEYSILSATADTPMDALRVLAASTPYPLNFCQLRLFIISYEMASTTALRPLLREWQELPNMRPNATVAVALGNALEVMAAQKPDFGMRLSTHLNLLFERLQAADMLPNSTLSSCVRDLEQGREDPLLLICAVNPQLVPKQEGQQGGQSGGQGGGQGGGEGGQGGSPAFASGEPWSLDLLPDSLMAGLLPHTSSNPVEYLGSAAVSDNRVSGLLDASNTQLILRAKRSAKRAVAVSDSSLQLQLHLSNDVLLLNNKDALLQAVKRLQLLDSDALGFGAACAMTCYTNAQWQALSFSQRYEHADVVLRTD